MDGSWDFGPTTRPLTTPHQSQNVFGTWKARLWSWRNSSTVRVPRSGITLPRRSVSTRKPLKGILKESSSFPGFPSDSSDLGSSDFPASATARKNLVRVFRQPSSTMSSIALHSSDVANDLEIQTNLDHSNTPRSPETSSGTSSLDGIQSSANISRTDSPRTSCASEENRPGKNFSDASQTSGSVIEALQVEVPDLFYTPLASGPTEAKEIDNDAPRSDDDDSQSETKHTTYLRGRQSFVYKFISNSAQAYPTCDVCKERHKSGPIFNSKTVKNLLEECKTMGARELGKEAADTMLKNQPDLDIGAQRVLFACQWNCLVQNIQRNLFSSKGLDREQVLYETARHGREFVTSMCDRLKARESTHDASFEKRIVFEEVVEPDYEAYNQTSMYSSSI